MIEVEGEYCPVVEQYCQNAHDDQMPSGFDPGGFEFAGSAGQDQFATHSVRVASEGLAPLK